jgi:transmembrane sensor
MSGMSYEGQCKVGRAEETDERAAHWLARRYFNSWSAENQAELDAWLTESHNHAAAYWRLKAAWERTERLAALRPPILSQASAGKDRRIWNIFSGAAIVCAAAVILGAAVSFLFAPAKQTYATAIGGHTTIALADGSQVELNTNTIVRADLTAYRRTVEVEKGEAYFQIAHDSNRPFVVVAANHRIVDLGTKFLVRNNPNHLEVVLVEGRARLETAGTWAKAHSAVLTQGDVAIATADSISVAKKPSEAVTNELAWRQGILVFKHITLGDAAMEFNRYNSTQLIVTADVAPLKIDGTFATGSVGPFARMAEFALRLHVQNENGQIVISR